MSLESSSSSSTVSYLSDADIPERAEFALTFDEPTTAIGFPKARLWVSCRETDDLDLYVSIRKVSKEGRILEHVNVPWRSLPEGVNTQDDVPSNGALKVSILPWTRAAQYHLTVS